MAQLSIESVKVEKLVKEFLTAQSLTILPQNTFGDAVSQFVDKDDKHAMEVFVNDSLSNQVKHLLEANVVEEEDITEAMDEYRNKLEELFAHGLMKKSVSASSPPFRHIEHALTFRFAQSGRRFKPKPDNWDSDLHGDWEDQPAALIRSDDEGDHDPEGEGSVLPATAPAARARAKPTVTTRKPPAKAPSKPAARTARSRAQPSKQADRDAEAHDDADIIMVDGTDEQDDGDDDALFIRSQTAHRAPERSSVPVTASTSTRSTRSTATASRQPPVRSTRAAPSRGTKGRQPFQVRNISKNCQHRIGSAMISYHF